MFFTGFCLFHTNEIVCNWIRLDLIRFCFTFSFDNCCISVSLCLNFFSFSFNFGFLLLLFSSVNLFLFYWLVLDSSFNFVTSVLIRNREWYELKIIRLEFFFESLVNCFVNFRTFSRQSKLTFPSWAKICRSYYLFSVLIIFRACRFKWFGFTADLPLKLITSSSQRQ